MRRSRAAIAGRGGDRGAQRAPRRRRPADDRHVSRPACRRGLLRQYRQHATGSISPWSAPPSTRSAASPRCAARSTSRAGLRRLRRRVGAERPRLVSVGRYALRGVGSARNCSPSIPEAIRKLSKWLRVGRHSRVYRTSPPPRKLIDEPSLSDDSTPSEPARTGSHRADTLAAFHLWWRVQRQSRRRQLSATRSIL